jgi:hypothetical protein
MIEPTTWVPSAAGTMPQPTAAAEPLLDPPGVRSGSHGLRVPRGSLAANSVVTVLPGMTAPASRKAATLAASPPVSQKPVNSGEPCPVGMSAVSMMSLMPIGMPSIGESGRLARHRSVEASAAPGKAAVAVDEGTNRGFELGQPGQTTFKQCSRCVYAGREMRDGRRKSGRHWCHYGETSRR